LRRERRSSTVEKGKNVSPTSTRNDSRGTRILVVENDANDRELLLHPLRKAGLPNHTKFISEGHEALGFLTGSEEKAIAKNLIAIFTDLKLDGMEGIELLHRLRQHEAYAETPVIVMTSSHDPPDWEECQRLKVSHFVTKPVSLSAFAKAIADTFYSSPCLRTSSLARVAE
jgi:CheY-like chemotaxis protein